MPHPRATFIKTTTPTGGPDDRLTPLFDVLRSRKHCRIATALFECGGAEHRAPPVVTVLPSTADSADELRPYRHHLPRLVDGATSSGTAGPANCGPADSTTDSRRSSTRFGRTGDDSRTGDSGSARAVT